MPMKKQSATTVRILLDAQFTQFTVSSYGATPHEVNSYISVPGCEREFAKVGPMRPGKRAHAGWRGLVLLGPVRKGANIAGLPEPVGLPS